jgi:hypothetical protein
MPNLSYGPVTVDQIPDFPIGIGKLSGSVDLGIDRASPFNGSVMDIDLSAAPVNFTLAANQIGVYPTPKRALTSLVSPQLSGQQMDYSEMVLQDLDNLKATTSGTIDMPGAAQALTFQGVPGKPSCFAQLRVYDVQAPVRRPIEVVSAASAAAVSAYWPETFALDARNPGLLASASATILTPQQRPPVQPAAPNFAAQPWVPSPADIAAFQRKVAAAMSATATAAAAAGRRSIPTCCASRTAGTIRRPFGWDLRSTGAVRIQAATGSMSRTPPR